MRSSKIDPTNRTSNSNDAAALFDLLTAASGGDLATVQALLVSTKRTIAFFFLLLFGWMMH